MIEESKGWCCELCGSLIKGLCNNENGRVTHIDSCIIESEKDNNVQENKSEKNFAPQKQSSNTQQVQTGSLDNTQHIKEENSITNPPPNVEPLVKPLCLFCLKELLLSPTGRKRRYCNKKCGTKYWIQQNKEKFNDSCRIASREYQRRKQKAKVEAREKSELALKEKMSKDNFEELKGGNV